MLSKEQILSAAFRVCLHSLCDAHNTFYQMLDSSLDFSSEQTALNDLLYQKSFVVCGIQVVVRFACMDFVITSMPEECQVCTASPIITVDHKRWCSDKKLLLSFVQCDLAQILCISLIKLGY